MIKGKVSILLVFLFSGLLALPAIGGSDKEEKRKVESFNELGLAISADVLIYQSDKTELTIIGSPSVIEHIETEVLGGELRIRYDKNWLFRNRYDRVKIILSSPSWEIISVSGSGTVKNANNIKETEIELAVSGSGLIKLNGLISSEILARISGSGDIFVAGTKTAGKLGIHISGSGDVNASGLETENVSVKISGSGDASVNVKERLEVSISGSGDVDYYGDAIVDARISGSGDVNKKD